MPLIFISESGLALIRLSMYRNWKTVSIIWNRDDYGFDRFLEQGGAASDLDVAKFVGKALFKGFLYPRFLGGSFGCSTLSTRNPKGGVMYGRNFDWMECTSMVVKSKPERGYASVSTVNLDFLNLGTEYDPEKTVSKIISAAALYAPMDGINEEGLCVAVLMIDDSAVTEQDTGKPDLTTTTAVRLLLVFLLMAGRAGRDLGRAFRLCLCLSRAGASGDGYGGCQSKGR